MIDIKPPEEKVNEQECNLSDYVPKEEVMKIIGSREVRIELELHELNKTLKEILREMRKRKWLKD